MFKRLKDLERDVIELGYVEPGTICYSAQCRREGHAAVTKVTFGRLTGLWPDVRGRDFDMCHGCWRQAVEFATSRVPGLTVRAVPREGS